MKKKGASRKGKRTSVDTVPCAYCGIRKAIEQEDVVARGFFPNLKPSDRILVPSCSECNRGTEKHEEYLRAVFMTMIETEGLAAAEEVRKRVYRSFAYKRGLVRTLKRSIERVSVTTPAGILLPEVPIIGADERRMQLVFRKIVRGLHYHLSGTRFPDSHEVLPYIPGMGEPLQDAMPSAIDFAKRGDHRQIADGNVFQYWIRKLPESEDVYWLLLFYGVIPVLAVAHPIR